MKISALFSSAGEWTREGGPHHQIVISSRVRLARNLRGHPFPGWSKKSDRLQILELIKPRVEALPEMEDALSSYLQELSLLEKQALVERHLISREHAAKGAGSAVVIDRKQHLSIMINEEDHLRMQVLLPGLQLHNAFQALDKVDTELEAGLDYAFHPQLGYLTACPTNVGTGMRASAMIHLPGLVLSEQINPVIQAVNKIGLAVRGLYGEGTEAMGNLFQISNQITLGEPEWEIIAQLNKVIEKIIENEANARQVLLQKKPGTLLDNIGRAFGILSHAYAISSKEALNLLSFLKLGVDLGFFPAEKQAEIDELFTVTQPAHLQNIAVRPKLEPEERDTLRAEIIRAKLKAFPAPDTRKIVRPSTGEPHHE